MRKDIASRGCAAILEQSTRNGASFNSSKKRLEAAGYSYTKLGGCKQIIEINVFL